eukprot:scaffold3271_cov181-Amphora_coffeaeformis.AAC.3
MDSTVSLKAVLKHASNCPDTPLAWMLGTQDEDPEIHKAIVRGQVTFALDPQVSLQASLAVVMATLAVTTGKLLAAPLTGTYFSGPKLVEARNVPSDTAALCAQVGFPVCSDDVALVANDQTTMNSKVCPCAQRRQIRIGGVLHASTTDPFWDPVFASAEQAAKDMKIDLDLFRFPPQEDFSIIVE